MVHQAERTAWRSNRTSRMVPEKVKRERLKKWNDFAIHSKGETKFAESEEQFAQHVQKGTCRRK